MALIATASYSVTVAVSSAAAADGGRPPPQTKGGCVLEQNTCGPWHAHAVARVCPSPTARRDPTNGRRRFLSAEHGMGPRVCQERVGNVRLRRRGCRACERPWPRYGGFCVRSEARRLLPLGRAVVYSIAWCARHEFQLSAPTRARRNRRPRQNRGPRGRSILPDSVVMPLG